MNKLKSLGSSFGNASALTSNKLSKAFRFDGKKNVLEHSNGSMAHQFGREREFGERSLPKWHLILHIISLFFSFLAICTIGAVAGFQAKWTGVSGGTGFSLLLILLAFLLQLGLIIVPTVYDRWEKLKRPAQFLYETRARLVLNAFGTILLFLVAMIVTISAWTAPGCKKPDNDPHASLGDEFKEALGQWCTTKKAAGIFGWLSLICWLILLTLTAIVFRRERRRTPGFVPPNSDERYDASDFQHPDPYAESKQELYDAAPQRSMSERAHTQGVRFASPALDDFEQPYASSGYRPANSFSGYAQQPETSESRTMQLAKAAAYSDPYAHIRASLQTSPPPQGNHGYGHNAQPYAAGGTPPSYGGYR